MAPPEEASTVPQTVPGTVSGRSRRFFASGRRGVARVPKGGALIRPVLAGLGAFLIVLGLLLRFYAAPRLVAAPPGFYIVISLVAPHATYFDESTLSTQHDATLTYNDTIRGDAAAGTATIAVWDQFTVLEDLRRNVQLIATFERSAFNRRTGELTNCCGASVNDDTQARQDGIGVVFWPIGTQKTTYQVYDTNTERAWPAAYSGTVIVQGLLTYRFTQRIPATVVQQMPDVPTSLLGLPGPSRNVVADRTFQATNTFWVDPRTGVPVKAQEQILSVLRGPGGKGSLLAADADLTMSPASQRALAAVARGNAASIATLRKTGPLGGLILGALLLLAGTVPVRRIPRVPLHRLPRRTRQNPAA
jgi:Porin PorA